MFMQSISRHIILITILNVAQSRLVRLAADTDDKKDADKKDKGEDANYVRHVIEDGVSPALFGSNKYDPIKRSFDLGNKSTVRPPGEGSTKVYALNKTEEHPKEGDDKKKGDHQGEPKEGEHKEGEHKEGEHKEGEHKEGEHKEGEHKEGEPKEGESKEGEKKEDDGDKSFRRGKEDELSKVVKKIYAKMNEKKGERHKVEEKGKGTTKKEQKDKNLLRKRLVYAAKLLSPETQRAFNPFKHDDATTDWWNLLKKKIKTSKSPLKTFK